MLRCATHCLKAYPAEAKPPENSAIAPAVGTPPKAGFGTALNPPDAIRLVAAAANPAETSQPISSPQKGEILCFCAFTIGSSP